MPLPVIADTMRVASEGHLANGNKWVNVFHIRKSAALTYAGAIVIADPLVFALYNANLGGGGALKNTWKTTQGLDRIRYTPLDNSTPTTIIGHALAGVSAVDPLPARDSCVVTWYTALRGRNHRGRSFLPPFTENDNDASGAVVAGTVTSLQLQFTGWLNSFSGSGTSLVVASYLGAGSAENVTSLLVRSVFSQQRRRSLVA